ncbi:hypothetical protein BGP75_22965 [Motiliproteus sp. MSK22-1]|nr:hypothetical protein BGP75_22965 [Motiliproteus sp. MSK22-1]
MGLLDSGIAAHQTSHLVEARSFGVSSEANQSRRDFQDLLGHGSTLAQILVDQVPNVQICIARIFDRRLATSAENAARGIDWLVSCGVQVINLSFGLRQDRTSLALACDRALEAGVVLVASSPAMGEIVYPARYPGVIRVTGDARCQPGEHSWSPSNQAHFGACVRAGHERVIGASVATAYISALVCQCIQAHSEFLLNPQQLQEWLRQRARFQGAQKPFSLVPWRRRLTQREDIKS